MAGPLESSLVRAQGSAFGSRFYQSWLWPFWALEPSFANRDVKRTLLPALLGSREERASLIGKWWFWMRNPVWCHRWGLCSDATYLFYSLPQTSFNSGWPMWGKLDYHIQLTTNTLSWVKTLLLLTALALPLIALGTFVLSVTSAGNSSHPRDVSSLQPEHPGLSA